MNKKTKKNIKKSGGFNMKNSMDNIIYKKVSKKKLKENALLLTKTISKKLENDKLYINICLEEIRNIEDIEILCTLLQIDIKKDLHIQHISNEQHIKQKIIEFKKDIFVKHAKKIYLISKAFEHIRNDRKGSAIFPKYRHDIDYKNCLDGLYTPEHFDIFCELFGIDKGIISQDKEETKENILKLKKKTFFPLKDILYFISIAISYEEVENSLYHKNPILCLEGLKTYEHCKIFCNLFDIDYNEIIKECKIDNYKLKEIPIIDIKHKILLYKNKFLKDNYSDIFLLTKCISHKKIRYEFIIIMALFIVGMFNSTNIINIFQIIFGKSYSSITDIMCNIKKIISETVQALVDINKLLGAITLGMGDNKEENNKKFKETVSSTAGDSIRNCLPTFNLFRNSNSQNGGNIFSNKDMYEYVKKFKKKHALHNLTNNCLKELKSDIQIENFTYLFNIDINTEKDRFRYLEEEIKNIIRIKSFNKKKILDLSPNIEELNKFKNKNILVYLKDITDIIKFCKLFNIDLDYIKNINYNNDLLKKNIIKSKKIVFYNYEKEIISICNIISSRKKKSVYNDKPLLCLEPLKTIEELLFFCKLFNYNSHNIDNISILKSYIIQLLIKECYWTNYEEIYVISKKISVTYRNKEYLKKAGLTLSALALLTGTSKITHKVTKQFIEKTKEEQKQTNEEVKDPFGVFNG